MIKGLSDAFTMPLLGRIGLGEKTIASESGKEHPENRPYFVINESEDFEGNTVSHTNDWLSKLKTIYGEKPTYLEGWFPCDDSDVFAPQYLKAYAANKLVCMGDGEKACWYRDSVKLAQASRTPADLVESDIDTTQKAPMFPPFYDYKPNSVFRTCKFRDCKHFCAAGTRGKICRPVMEMLFVIPRVSQFGVFKITTSSEITIRNLNAMIRVTRDQAKKSGYEYGIQGVPLKIYKKRIATSYKKDGTYIVDIQMHPEFIAKYQDQIEDARQNQMVYYGEAIKALPLTEGYVHEAPKELVTPEYEIETAQRVQTVDDWLADPLVIELFATMETLSGKKIMPAKRRERASKCESLKELTDAMSAGIENLKAKTVVQN